MALPSGDGGNMKKYEREIRDLLEQLDTFVPDNPAPDKERSRDREPEREPRKRSVGVMPPQPPIPIRSRRSTTSRFSQWLTNAKVSAGLRMMLGGLFLVILALVIAQNFRDLTPIAQIIGAIGGMVFLMPVLFRFFRGKEMDSGPDYWRGQEVQSESFSWSSLRTWWRGRGNRRGGNDPWNDRNRKNRF